MSAASYAVIGLGTHHATAAMTKKTPSSSSPLLSSGFLVQSSTLSAAASDPLAVSSSQQGFFQSVENSIFVVSSEVRPGEKRVLRIETIDGKSRNRVFLPFDSGIPDFWENDSSTPPKDAPQKRYNID